MKWLAAWRSTVVNKDRSHPDLFCCVCGAKESGLSYWCWTNESTPRRICFPHYNSAQKTNVSSLGTKIDYLCFQHPTSDKGIQQMIEWHQAELKRLIGVCCICGTSNSGGVFWRKTEENPKRLICKPDFELAKERNVSN
jgi:hypothetical protein